MTRIEVDHGDEIVVRAPAQGEVSITLIAKAVEEREEILPYIDIVDELPVNPNPISPTEWWRRTPDQIKGITVHHTMSNDIGATARYCIDNKGRPSIQYNFWVSSDGRVFLCAPLSWGMWHDQTGHENKNISLGMAGRLHENRPTEAELRAAARIAAWSMEQFDIPIDNVLGHIDRWSTECPGWDTMNWRSDFYTALNEELE